MNRKIERKIGKVEENGSFNESGNLTENDTKAGKKGLKKVLAGALIMAFLCFGLAGCGSKAESADTTPVDSIVSGAQSVEETKETKETGSGYRRQRSRGRRKYSGRNRRGFRASKAGRSAYRLLKGPTSMGLLFLMEDAKNGEAKEDYSFQMATGVDEILPLMIKEDLDIVLVPANIASILYHRMEGEVSVIDINTLGVLYMVSAQEGIESFENLKGRTIYLTGKGTTPDYVLQYLLAQNGMSTEDVTLEYKSEATEVAAVLAENPDAVGLLPQPFVTAACAQNESLKVVLDMNREWQKVQGETVSGIVTGVTVVRKAFLEEHEDAVETFLEEHEKSTQAINADQKKGAELAVEAQIVAKEPIAKKAIPECNITCIRGEEMKQALKGYLEVLYEQSQGEAGGDLPEDDFYYEGK